MHVFENLMWWVLCKKVRKLNAAWAVERKPNTLTWHKLSSFTGQSNWSNYTFPWHENKQNEVASAENLGVRLPTRQLNYNHMSTTHNNTSNGVHQSHQGFYLSGKVAVPITLCLNTSYHSLISHVLLLELVPLVGNPYRNKKMDQLLIFQSST